MSDHAASSARSVGRARPPRGWKNPVNRGLSLLLYLALCVLVGTGGLMWLRLPPGSGGGRGKHRAVREVLGMSRHDWGDIHLYIGLGFLAICLLHIALNWTWMMKIAASRKPWRVWAGLATGVAIVVVLVMLPVT